MVRVSGLREQAFGDGAPQDYSPDGLRPLAQLQKICTANSGSRCARSIAAGTKSVLPQLAEQGIRLLRYEQA